MSITVEDVLKKYDTNIDINSVSNNLKKVEIFSDEAPYTINDLKKPKHKKEKNIDMRKFFEEYSYECGDGNTIIIIFDPSNYRNMLVQLIQDTGLNTPPYVSGWEYDGQEIYY